MVASGRLDKFAVVFFSSHLTISQLGDLYVPINGSHWPALNSCEAYKESETYVVVKLSNAEKIQTASGGLIHRHDLIHRQ